MISKRCAKLLVAQVFVLELLQLFMVELHESMVHRQVASMVMRVVVMMMLAFGAQIDRQVAGSCHRCVAFT